MYQLKSFSVPDHFLIVSPWPTEHDVRDIVEKTIREEIQQGNYIVTTEKPTIIGTLRAILKLDSDKVSLDQYQFLGNCAPTPPLTQHLIISK